jgi:hypothetical protein
LWDAFPYRGILRIKGILKKLQDFKSAKNQCSTIQILNNKIQNYPESLNLLVEIKSLGDLGEEKQGKTESKERRNNISSSFLIF